MEGAGKPRSDNHQHWRQPSYKEWSAVKWSHDSSAHFAGARNNDKWRFSL